MQLTAPAKLYCPSGHADAVDDVDPAPHTYPAVHSPSQKEEDRPVEEPYRPARHSELHSAVVAPGLPQYPGEHGPVQVLSTELPVP